MKRWARVCWLYCSLIATAPATLAADPPTMIADLRHDSWNDTQGAPVKVGEMAQTVDGWLWIAAGPRLTRFDGARFLPFAPSNGTRPMSVITALAPDPKGPLYVGYASGGLSVVSAGRLDHLFDMKTITTVYKLALDRSGALWIASLNGLHRYADGRLETVDESWGYPAKRAEYVHADAYGRIWALTGKALYLLDPKAKRFNLIQAAKSDSLILDAPDGRTWLHQDDDLSELLPPEGGKPLARDVRTNHSMYQSLFDLEGNFWTGNRPKGLCRIPRASFDHVQQISTRDPATECLTEAWQLSSPAIGAVLQDREGNVWVGTLQGLDRFRNQAIHMIPQMEGYQGYMAVADAKGVVWAVNNSVSAPPRLWRIENGHAERMDNPRGYEAVGGDRGSIVLAGPGGLEFRTEQGNILIPLPEQHNKTSFRSERRVSHIDVHGSDIRLSLMGEGIYHWRDGQWTYEEKGALGRRTFRTVDVAGRVWEAFPNKVLQVSDGPRVKTLGAAQGLDIGTIGFMQTEPELLVSGADGLQIWRNGKFEWLRLEQGGESPQISGLVVDAQGDRWLNMSAGLLRVTPADWANAVNNPSARLRGKLFGQLDGFRGGAEVATRMRSAFMTPDGRLWLTSTRGVAWLHPNALPRNPVAPGAELLNLTAANQQYRFDQLSPLAPGTRQLAIEYTAPSYTMPERVRFRYRLHGLDQGWQEVGGRREAVYNSLKPGSYTFEVVALNEDGVAGRPALSPPITIKPTFTETPWFIVLLCVVGAMALTLAYRLRMHQLTRRFVERSMVQLDERERIARTLHDSFLQNVQVLLLKVRGVAHQLPMNEPARLSLERVLEEGTSTLAEGRDELQALRSELPEGADMADALREVAASGLHTAEVHIHGALDTLDQEVAGEVFAIAREALRNALRHSGAKRIEVALRDDAAGKSVTVADNGSGIVAASPMGHFGMKGMRERADRIGARLTVDSGAGGTTVTLRIAPPLAARWYRKRA